MLQQQSRLSAALQQTHQLQMQSPCCGQQPSQLQSAAVLCHVTMPHRQQQDRAGPAVPVKHVPKAAADTEQDQPQTLTAAAEQSLTVKH